MKRPAEIYRRSDRHLADLADPEYPLHDLVVMVKDTGHIYLPGSGRRGQYYLTQALSGQTVGLREVADDAWQVSFMTLDLGMIDAVARKFTPDVDPKGS